MDLWPSYGLILTKSDQAVLLGLPYERAPVNAIFHMERLSPMEVEVFLDRRKFMERFMEVCAQYTTSNKQLSPIST